MAEKLQLKIVGYDDDHNLLVSFATDASKNSVENYPTYSFQPHRYQNITADEIVLQIAKQGLNIALEQDAKEKHAQNTGKVIDLQDLVGVIKEFNIIDLKPTENLLPENLTDILVK